MLNLIGKCCATEVVFKSRIRKLQKKVKWENKSPRINERFSPNKWRKKNKKLDP